MTSSYIEESNIEQCNKYNKNKMSSNDTGKKYSIPVINRCMVNANKRAPSDNITTGNSQDNFGAMV